MDYHVPVMVAEVVRELVADPDGIYLDATAGGGGHSREIAAQLGEGGRLVATDRDAEAVTRATASLADFGERVEVFQRSFEQLRDLLSEIGVTGLNGALFDLGVSSHQIDEASRGFSYREEGPLDMRMDSQRGETAAGWIARASEEELTQVIRDYGEERHARRIARSICRRRREGELMTTADLRSAVEVTRPQMLNKTLARVFQAFRIAVNDELGQLQRGLEVAVDMLVAGGRLVVIAYHSLEDRLVKQMLAQLMRGCICPPELPVCTCGHKPSFKKGVRRPLRASAEEVRQNRRARSAIMRVYEKL